jgi:hypothetical protein
MKSISNRVERFNAQIRYSVVALALLCICHPRALAQNDHAHIPKPDQSAVGMDLQNALVKIVRDSTEQFKDVSAAIAAGYTLQFGCVSGDDYGAMGLHYVNGDLVNKGVLDATKPQIVIYEAQPDGTLQLIGADYLLLAAAWDATHSSPPELMGQFFHLFTSPNRFGLPNFYTLHVWAWKGNPQGAFVNWHPDVSCASYAGKKP